MDAEKFCNVTWFFGYKAGQVTSCLRDVKGQVSKGCKAELFKVMKDVSRRMRAGQCTAWYSGWEVIRFVTFRGVVEVGATPTLSACKEA